MDRIRSFALISIILLFAIQGFAQTVTIGSGTLSQRQPFGIFWGYERSAAIYTSNEINYSGLISTLSWQVATTQTSTAPIKIYLKTDTSTTLTADTWTNTVAGATLVYTSSKVFSSSGWDSFQLATPYFYNKNAGNLHVLVVTEYTGTGTSAYPYFYYHTATSQHEYWYADNSPPTGNGTVNASRPHIKIDLSSYLNDAGVSVIDSPVSPLTPGMSSIYLRISNFGLDTLFSASVNWQVDNSSVTSSSWNDTLTTAGSSDLLSVGSFNFSNGFHTIKAWTASPNGQVDSNTVNDTLIKSVIVCNPLSGTYNIGVNRNIKTISEAITALNLCGVSGAVTFLIDTGTYQEQLSIGEIFGASSTNTITFKSINGDKSEVLVTFPSSTSAIDNYVVYLDGADYITFKDISFERTGTNTNGAVIDFSNGATNNNFLGNKFSGVISGSTSVYASVVISSSAAIDSNNYFYNNEIENGSYGVNLVGSSNVQEFGNQFIENEITGFYYYGIRMEYQIQFVIKGNSVFATETAPYSTNYGMYLYYCDGGFQIEGNHLVLRGTSTNYLLYPYYCDGDSSNHGLIANNFLINANGTGTNYGIYPYNCNYVDIFYNSVNIAFGSSTATKAIYPYPSSSTGAYSNIRILNNVLVNKAGGYAIDIPTNAATLGYVTVCDYNDLYSSGTNLGRYGTTDAVTLSAWVTASGLDSNSISIDPGFKSTIDLHISKIGIDSMATPLSGISMDIDGDSRDASFPDIGADEYTPDSFDVAITYIEPITQPACEGSYQIQARVKNFGYMDIDSVTVNWEINGSAQTPYKYASKILSGNDTLLTLGYYSFGYTQTYSIKIFPSASNYGIDGDAENDTAWLNSLEFYEIPGIPSVADDTICSGQVSTLTASGSPASYAWYDSMNGGSVLDTGAVFKTNALSSSTTFYVESVNVPLSASSIVITELDMNTPDFVEIQNVSGQTVNTTGWKVLVSDDYSLINDINTLPWNLPTSMTSNQVLYQTDVTTDNYWGNNLYFISGNNGWAMILDNNDNIVDFIAWGWDSASLAGMSLTYNSKTITLGNEWLGDGINSTCTNSLQRLGGDDNNKASDFSCATISKGTANTGLSTPFPGGGYLCSSSRIAVNVIVSPAPTVDIPIRIDSICENNTYQLNATAQNYGTLSWNNNGDGSFNNSGILDPLYTPGSADIANGYVSIWLTANSSSNCSAIVADSMYLNIIKKPTVDAGIDATICSAIDFSLNGIATEYNSIEWTSTGDGSFVDDSKLIAKYNLGSSDLAGGTIYLILKATSNKPCNQIVYDSLELTIAMGPVVTAGIDAIICENGNYQLNATALNYNSFNWTTAGYGSFDNNAKLDAVYTPGTNDKSAGNVELIIIAYGNPPCSVISDTMLLSINSLATVDAGIDFKLCENSNYQLSAVATHYTSSNWISNGGGIFSSDDSLSSTYYPSASEIAAGSAQIIITVLGLDQCAANYDTIDVEIAKLATVNAGVGGQVCTNETFQLNGSSSPANDLYWASSYHGNYDNNKILNPVYSPIKADELNGSTYLSLYVQSDPVCDYVIDSVELLIKPLPDVDLGNDTILCAEQKIKLDAGAGYDKYSWSNNAVASNITVDSSWVGIGTAVYWVEVTNDGCKTRDTIRITFKICGSIEDALGNMHIDMYPNPSQGQIYLQLNGQSSNLSIDIYTTLGQLIHSELVKSFSGQKTLELDLRNQAKGVYLVKLANDKGEAVVKLILE